MVELIEKNNLKFFSVVLIVAIIVTTSIFEVKINGSNNWVGAVSKTLSDEKKEPDITKTSLDKQDDTLVDQFVFENAKYGNIYPADISGYRYSTPQLIFSDVSGRDSIFIGIGQASTTQLLPNIVTNNYIEDSFDGYIIKLDQPSLAEEYAELTREINDLKKLSETTTSRASIEKKIDELIAARKTKLVQHQELISREQGAAESSIKVLATLARIENKFSISFNGFHVTLTAKDAQILKSNGYKIWSNRKVQAVLMDSVSLINADDVWLLKDAEGKNITGKGIKIAIIDTGVDYTHLDLGGCFGQNCKVAGGYDIVNKDSDPMDDNGHGTHVAAIAAGKGVLNGVAPDAAIFSYKVINARGWGYTSWIIKGIDRALDPNRDNDLDDAADILSLSLGGWGDPDDPLSQAVDNAVLSGAIVVVAAGNQGSRQGTISSPGTARNAITVGASTKQDEIASFSSRAPVMWNNKTIVKPDLVAPGVSICAAQWDEWLSNRRCLDTYHISISGTSMATPHIAGAAALLKQAHPYWSTTQIKAALKNTANNIGWSTLDRGAGRVDILKAVNQSDEPPVAELEPISTTERVRKIRGKIATKHLKAWSIAYAALNPYSPETKWVELKKGTQLTFSYVSLDLETKTIPDGEYIIRLLVDDMNGQTGIDYGYIFIDKIHILYPLNWDIFRAGDLIPVKLNFDFDVRPQKILLEYGIGKNVSQWVPINNTEFWDTTNLTTGWYTLRAVITHNGIEEQEKVTLYLDSTLKKGWPVRIPWELSDCGDFQCYYWGGFIEPVVADLNEDGLDEIIVFAGGDPPKLHAYNYNGSRLWVANVGTSPVAGVNLHIPIIYDIDHDGKKEIVAYDIGDINSDFSLLYAFKSNGEILEGWPVKVPKDWHPTIIAADVNQDGRNELIIQGNDWFPEAMVIVEENGKIISQWNMSDIKMGGFITSTPAVGNFDDDKDLEIVVARPSKKAGLVKKQKNWGWNNEGEIHVFNWNGSEVMGWPVKTSGVIFSSPVVGDLNKDGQNEIVVGLMYFSDIFPDMRYGGLYVFDNKGSVLAGWPVMKGYNYWSSPSVGDLDGDGDLEIAVSRLGFNTEVYHHNAQLLKNWPQKTGGNDYYSSIIGDINVDKAPDVLTSAGGIYVNGGIYGWTANGSLIPGFTKLTEDDAQASPVIADLDSNERAEIAASSDFDFNPEKNMFKHRGSIYVWEMPSNFNLSTMHWPTFHRDVERSGLYKDPDLPDLTISKYEIIKLGSLFSYKIIVSNIGSTESGKWELQVKGSSSRSKIKVYSSLKSKESRMIKGNIFSLPVTFIVDPKEKVNELNEGNNILTITVPTQQPNDFQTFKQEEGP